MVEQGVGKKLSNSNKNNNDTTDDDDENSTKDDESNRSALEIFYFLWTTNDQFRIFLVSMLVNHLGEWFTYIACVRFLEDVYPGQSHYTAISVLVILGLIPNLLFSSIGGVLADAHDRRNNMIILDCIASVTALGYLLAVEWESITLIYVLVFIEQTLEVLYIPNYEAMIPMVVKEDEELLEVTATIFEVSFATIAAFGASLGGFCVLLLGMRACFILDSATYLFCVWYLSRLHGSWTASDEDSSDEEETSSSDEDESSSSSDEEEEEEEEKEEEEGEDGNAGRPQGEEGEKPHDKTDSTPQLPKKNKKKNYFAMFVNGIQYIFTSTIIGPVIFIKATGMIVYGPTEILAVSFSDIEDDPDLSSARLGIMYAFYGIGCIVGPIVSNFFTNIKNPRTLQLACIISFAIIALSWIGMAELGAFASRCFFMALSSCGAEILWLDSTLLLMKFSKKKVLGRVSSFDNTLAISSEAISAVIAGILLDYGSMSAIKVSWIFAIVGLALVLLWFILHLSGTLGVPRETSETVQNETMTNHRANNSNKNDEAEQEKTEATPLFHS